VSQPLQFGYVSRAHGLDGEIVIKTFDPASEVLDEVDRIKLKLRDGGEREYVIEEVAEAPGGDLRVVLEGVKNRPTAEKLVGSTVFAFREDLEAPAAGEFFQGDLIGLAAQDEQGAALGTLEEIWNTGPVPNLVVRGGPGGELLVPFADEYVVKVDLQARTIVIKVPEFL
jgi:16S rRNA processing protein RimM